MKRSLPNVDLRYSRPHDHKKVGSARARMASSPSNRDRELLKAAGGAERPRELPVSGLMELLLHKESAGVSDM